jgi:hypothetical protein
MFLSALILASKYLQDRNYSARAWSMISGLSTLEINQNERAFVEAIHWDLCITETTFQQWTNVLLRMISSKEDSPCTAFWGPDPVTNQWKLLVSKLEPYLSNFDDIHMADRSSDADSCISMFSLNCE